MFEKVVASARLKSDPLARQILDFLEANFAAAGLRDPCVAYYGFPLFRDYEEALYQPTLLLIDSRKGVVSIRVVGLQFEINSEDQQLTELHSILFSKLLASRRLRKTRSTLSLPLTSILFLPPQSDTDAVDSENVVVSSLQGLFDELKAISSVEVDAETFSEARSLIEGVKALARPKPRDIPADGSKPKARVLQKLEEEILNFDANQRMAALTVPVGPQRIRGLAGSGKTIVLAWKAAHLHMQEPGKRILFTFYTRSLYDSIRRQVTRFYRHFRDSDPDWSMLHIMHAWGGRSSEGVYYNACIDNNVLPKNLRDVSNSKNPFQAACADLLRRTVIQQKYDMVLIDEAQDFPEEFFEVTYQLASGKRDNKRIIWAYDELQSIFDTKMRSPRELFGLDKDGEAKIDLDRAKAVHGLGSYVDNDLILKKCYRNPLEVLVCSHALGFGIYGPNIVQMLQNREHWEDLGYEVESGEFEVGKKTSIVRPKKNSPLSIQDYEQSQEIVKWFSAEDFGKELDWICDEVASFIDSGLAPDEILIICLDDRNAKNYFKALAPRLSARGISCHDLLADPFSTPHFQIDGSVTLSTVHRAKGNEAPAVIVCGLDALALDRKSRRARNRIFTAFTRTKGWLRVSGLSTAHPLFEELRVALGNSPRLVFTWPEPQAVETLQRDLSRKEEQARRLRDEYLKRLAELGYSEEDALREFAGQEKSE